MTVLLPSANGTSVDPSQPACGTVLSVCVMNIDLTGQTAVVTGAGRGIGLAVTCALTASGAHVIAGTRHSCAELDQLAAEGTVTTFEVDVAAPGQELAAWSPTW